MSEITIDRLIEAGGKLWEKNGMRRVYFNASAWGLEVNRYKTGSISSASIKGQGISNSEAGRCEAVKVWFDLRDGQFHTQNADGLHAIAREALNEFISNL